MIEISNRDAELMYTYYWIISGREGCPKKYDQVFARLKKKYIKMNQKNENLK